MSDTPRTIVIPGPFYGLTTDELYLKADALRAHAERLAEALNQMLLYFGSPKRDDWNSPQSFTQAKNTEANAMQALTLYRANNPKT